MNLILLFDDDVISAAGRVRLHGRRQAHVRNVMRPEVGDTLRVGRLNGALGTGRMVALTDAALEMDVTLTQAPPAPLPLTLLLALPRPKSLKRVLQAVTAMGVKRIVLMNAWRVEKSYWESPALHPRRFTRAPGARPGAGARYASSRRSCCGPASSRSSKTRCRPWCAARARCWRIRWRGSPVRVICVNR